MLNESQQEPKPRRQRIVPRQARGLCGSCASVFASIIVYCIVYRLLMFRYDNDNYRYRYRYRSFFGIIVSKCFMVRYPTLIDMNVWLSLHLRPESYALLLHVSTWAVFKGGATRLAYRVDPRLSSRRIPNEIARRHSHCCI